MDQFRILYVGLDVHKDSDRHRARSPPRGARLALRRGGPIFNLARPFQRTEPAGSSFNDAPT